MKNKSGRWLFGYFVIVIAVLLFIGYYVVKVDPFFHYHKPATDLYYYYLNNQRSQNDGIIKQFEYDALITGTSLTENFKTSEMDEIFGTRSVKVPFSGGSFKEINDNIKAALESNPNLKIIVRGLDLRNFTRNKDEMRNELGEYPTYLYDNWYFNDVKYIFNRDIIFNRVVPMLTANDVEGFSPGITSFDDYSNWMSGYSFGVNTVFPKGVTKPKDAEPVHLTESKKDKVLGTVHQNITDLAMEYPDVTFYYFFTPYSICWWRRAVGNGEVYQQVEAERIAIEEILKCDNIKLYSFNNVPEITADLNNYKDKYHYGSWINSLILRYMKDGKYLLTEENYETYLEEELELYTGYDYESLNNQVDYENDLYAEALLNCRINGVEPFDLLANDDLKDNSIVIDDISDYKYLVADYRKDRGSARVMIYDENGRALTGFELVADCAEDSYHQYLLNVSVFNGPVTLVVEGGYFEDSENPGTGFAFKNLILY